MLRIENLVKTYYQHTALDNINIHVRKGQTFGLLGPNGAGKTSLIRIINQITFPDTGKVFFDGEKLSPKHISQIGYLPEERGLYKDMKVGEQLLYLSQLKGLQKKEAKIRIKKWFDNFEIGSWENKKISDLSKGMAQKIQFIATVIHQPKLLIFDEPFSGFDPVNAQLIKEEILKLKKEGTTIIFSTHRMESVEEVCDSITLIHHSKNILEGSLEEVKNRFKKNLFYVHLAPNCSENSLSQIKQYRFVKNCQRQNDLFLLTLHSQDLSTNEMLKSIMNHGHICKFEEKLPSINEIFIELVSVNKNHL